MVLEGGGEGVHVAGQAVSHGAQPDLCVRVAPRRHQPQPGAGDIPAVTEEGGTPGLEPGADRIDPHRSDDLAKSTQNCPGPRATATPTPSPNQPSQPKNTPGSRVLRWIEAYSVLAASSAGLVEFMNTTERLAAAAPQRLGLFPGPSAPPAYAALRVAVRYAATLLAPGGDSGVTRGVREGGGAPRVPRERPTSARAPRRLRVGRLRAGFVRRGDCWRPGSG